MILLVVGVIMAIHALGGLDYHPSRASSRTEGAGAMKRLHPRRRSRCWPPAPRRKRGRRRAGRARLLARPVARLHLPGRVDRLAVRRQGRDLRRAQQRRLVRFRLFPRHRRVRRRRQARPHRLPATGSSTSARGGSADGKCRLPVREPRSGATVHFSHEGTKEKIKARRSRFLSSRLPSFFVPSCEPVLIAALPRPQRIKERHNGNPHRPQAVQALARPGR